MVRPKIRGLLIDLSGTLHVGSTPTENAAISLRQLRNSKIPFRFCSNTSKESTASLCKTLNEMGFDVTTHGSSQDVWTSLSATRRLIEKKGLTKPYFLLSESSLEEFGNLVNQGNDASFDSVVFGLAPSCFTYDHLNTAFRILTGEQKSHKNLISDTASHKPSTIPLPLIATHKAKYIRSPDGALSLGPGPFITALESATGIEAEVVGKPSRAFFEAVIADFRPDEIGDPSEGRIAIIGDDLESDLGGGAIELGLWRVLVRTGKYRPGDEERPNIPPPDEVCDSFATFVNSFLKDLH